MPRRRVFFFQGISHSALIKTLFYRILEQNVNGEWLTGSDMKNIITTLSNNFWIPSNDLVYKNLHKMEQEKQIESDWSKDIDLNKKFRRLYHITDIGFQDYFILKSQYLSLLKTTINVINIAIDFLFNSNEIVLTENTRKIKMSSTLFQELNILQLLSKEKKYIHGILIQEKLNKIYNDKWKPSFGTLYPVLSDLSVEGLAHDIWSLQGESSKLRSIREFIITPNGNAWLKDRKENTDLYQLLSDTKTMYENFFKFLS